MARQRRGLSQAGPEIVIAVLRRLAGKSSPSDVSRVQHGIVAMTRTIFASGASVRGVVSARAMVPILVNLSARQFRNYPAAARKRALPTDTANEQ